MTKQSQILRNNHANNKLRDQNGHNFDFFHYILRCLTLHDAKYRCQKVGAVALPFDFSPFFGFCGNVKNEFYIGQ